jgi:hypothetical protein
MKRIEFPHVPQTGALKRLQIGKVQQQPKNLHVVPPLILAIDDDFEFFQGLDPLLPSIPEQDNCTVQRLLQEICDISSTPVTPHRHMDRVPSELEQRQEYIKQIRNVWLFYSNKSCASLVK